MSFTRALARLTTVFIDTAPIIYYIEAHPQFGPIAKELIERVQSGKLYAFSSVITLVEVLPKPVKTGNETLVKTFSHFLRHGKNISLCEVSADVAEQAGRLRGQYPSIRGMDAIQLAIALDCGVDAFVTNDIRLQTVKEIPILVLKDYLP